MKPLQPAVFIDRDGTLIEDVHYLNKIEDIKLINGTINALKKLNINKIPSFMVSNQSGVARGYFDENNVKVINNEIKAILKADNVFLNGYYYCPHHPKGIVEKYVLNCSCRKPKIGMIEKCISENKNIDIKKSFVIGDKICDIELAKNAGCKGVLVQTGYGAKEDLSKVVPNYVAKNIEDAVNWILKELALY